MGALYLGVDGGGTSTRAVIVDAGGQECGRGHAGSANQTAVGLDMAVANIRQAVGQAARAAGQEPPLAGAWYGLAGVDRSLDKQRLLPRLAELAARTRLTNDAELGLAALPGTCGVCLIAGTGSIAVGRDRTGRHARAGGWGHVLGDEGSGYAMGRAALQAVTRAADGRGPATALTAAILHAWDLREPAAIITHVYPAGEKAVIAALAPLVLQHAGDDAVARRIVVDAANELAITALATAGQLDFPGPVPLALVGSLLIAYPALRAAVVRRIRRRRPVAPVVTVPDPALAAAQALARPEGEGAMYG
jgi:N-acetylglucosamine kinase-like BadF-type ATPase